MKVLSLFAGIGGLDIGLKAVGCKTHWYSEIDSYACKVMEKRFPYAVNIGDITQIEWEKLEIPDIICGGFPCQDISVAGKRAGIKNGTRSGLWSHFADAIRILRPRGVLVENVSALANRGLDRVLGDLAACGYDAEWDCIPAAAVGAPHRRDRIFILAYPNSAQRERRRLSLRTWPQHTNTCSTSWWETEPNVGRVANGVPNRAHRLRCLGNSVVPQVAEHVAHILVERIKHG